MLGLLIFLLKKSANLILCLSSSQLKMKFELTLARVDSNRNLELISRRDHTFLTKLSLNFFTSSFTIQLIRTVP